MDLYKAVNVYRIIILILLGVILLGYSSINTSNTLEIYTCTNIYYIEDNNVTDENGLVDLSFSSTKDLNTWLVERLTNELEENCKP